jgi:hypothetical protein
MFPHAPKRCPSSCDAKGRIANTSLPLSYFLLIGKLLGLFSMSSAFTNRRKPRKVGGDDEENDSDEQGLYPLTFADGFRSRTEAWADIYQTTGL